MRAEPQAAPYRPDPQILQISDWLASPVDAARFPQTILRFRNHRWDKTVGLDGLTDDEWTGHFGTFKPLADNLERPLALRYHGHQFRVYNPEIGDGRGFLFAQMRDADGRLLDLGTKGSGLTPFSRTADGRLTLKGAVREILATEMLEALGVYTSKTFSVVETGEALERGDEPSPTRSAVLVRLSHSHIRIGTFQRLTFFDELDHLEELTRYCLTQFPGPPSPPDAPHGDELAVQLMHQVVERLAALAASYMVAGFVHGVLNTDNMNITGESFDYGPWRWLPRWEPGFTAAYFDQTGLYAYGRQPDAIHWNCAQLAGALLPIGNREGLLDALNRFGPLYEAELAHRFCWRLGVVPKGLENDIALFQAAARTMRGEGIGPDEFHFRHRAGRNAEGELAEALSSYDRVALDHELWDQAEAPHILIEEVERIWSAIDTEDDWAPLSQKISEIRLLGEALGTAPEPAALSLIGTAKG